MKVKAVFKHPHKNVSEVFYQLLPGYHIFLYRVYCICSFHFIVSNYTKAIVVVLLLTSIK